MFVIVSRPIGILRGSILGERCSIDRASGPGSVEILAKDLFAEGGDVLRRDRRDSRCH